MWDGAVLHAASPSQAVLPATRLEEREAGPSPPHRVTSGSRIPGKPGRKSPSCRQAGTPSHDSTSIPLTCSNHSMILYLLSLPPALPRCLLPCLGVYKPPNLLLSPFLKALTGFIHQSCQVQAITHPSLPASCTFQGSWLSHMLLSLPGKTGFSQGMGGWWAGSPGFTSTPV